MDVYRDQPRVAYGGGGGGGCGLAACLAVLLTAVCVGLAAFALGKVYVDGVQNALNLQCTINLRDSTAGAVAEYGQMKSRLKRDLQTAYGCYLHLRTLSYFLMQNAPKTRQSKSTVGKIMNMFAGEDDSATEAQSASNFDPQVFQDCMLEMEVIEHWLQEDSGSRAQFKPKDRVADVPAEREESEDDGDCTR